MAHNWAHKQQENASEIWGIITQRSRRQLPKQEMGTLNRTGHEAMQALGTYGEVIDWTNKQASIGKALESNPLTYNISKQLRESKIGDDILNFSYHDARQGAVKWISGQNQAAGVAANIFLPDAIDFATGGVGYLDNIAKGINKYGRKALQKGDEIIDTAEGVARGLGKDLDNALQPAMALTGDGTAALSKSGNALEHTMMAIRGAGEGTGVQRIMDPGLLKGSKPIVRTRKARIAFDAMHPGKSKTELDKLWKEYPERYATGSTRKQTRSTSGFMYDMGLAPHHLYDLDLVGDTMNRTDAPEISKILREELDIFPGDHSRNFIGSFHDNTTALRAAKKKQIKDIWEKLIGPVPGNKTLDQALKTPSIGSEFGRHSKDGLPTLNQLIEISQKQPQSDWARLFIGSGKTPADLKLPQFILGVDHQMLIHAVADHLPARQKLVALTKTDAWLQLSPREAAKEIAKVVNEQQNVALQVASWRLDKITKRMGDLGLPNKDWHDVMKWIKDNPHEAATLDWLKTAQEGTGKSINQLIQPLPAKRAELVANVFAMEKAPNTAAMLKKFKTKLPVRTTRAASRAKQSKSELEAVGRDISRGLKIDRLGGRKPEYGF